MESRSANPMRCSFLGMNLGRRILAFTVLAVIVTVAAGAQSAPAVSPAEARTAIQAAYAEWAKARVAVDVNTMERMLAPDFYYQLPDQKLTRAQFVDRVHSQKPTRFDASVLTVEPKGNDWSVFVFLKIEIETKDKEGKTTKEYRAFVARDSWRKSTDNQWILTSSEPLGREQWKDERPPIANW